jgi:hypothetical protein
MRGTWFVGDMTKPCSWDLAEEIEKAYKWVKQHNCATSS